MQIGITAPASPVSPENLKNGIEWLEKKGFTVKLSSNIYKAERFMAGSDRERADDVNAMFADKNIDAVIAARGGYGSGRILPYLDYDMIAENKKPFIGLSDITALQLALFSKSAIASYTGLVMKTDFISPPSARLEKSLLSALHGEKQTFRNLKTLTGGKTEGIVLGGNLTMIVSLAGTPYFPDFKDKILFIEDIHEQPFRIDRMLNTLFLCGVFDSLKGIVIGDFSEAVSKDPADGTLEDVWEDRFARLGIPVVYGFLNGHINDKYLLKTGADIVLDADRGEINEI